MKRFIKNRKGIAEVIGTMLFIIILLFFFTNVYLWHDAATKEANQLYIEKINSTFKIEQIGETIVITANGGSGITLSRLWIIDNYFEAPPLGPGPQHYHADLGNVQVGAGESFNITFSGNTVVGTNGALTIATSQDGSIQVNYNAQAIQIGQNVTCTVINTLGIEESTIFQP